MENHSGDVGFPGVRKEAFERIVNLCYVWRCFDDRGEDHRETAGHHRARRPGHRNRACDCAAGRHLLGDSPGYGRRLPGALHRRHRPGHAELLAGNYGDDIPGHLVGLGAADGNDSFHGRPAGESGGVPHSQPDSGNGLVGCHHADDAHHDAGGAEAGLYLHRLVQGAPGAGRDYPAHPQKCPHSGGDPDRPAVADPGWGRRDHGEHLCNLPGIGRLLVNALNDTRLPHGFRNQPVFRHRGGAAQSPHRPDLSLSGPEGAV